MFQVDLSENRLVRLEHQRFSDLNLREREHLQEWLARTPDALGEELLIVQKEFDGFADTRERLDLLALDKEGRLVVIENKLDDSGRDVVWQALKYAAYCSSLTKAEIVDIYQRYLDRWFEGQDAKENLCDFLDVEDIDDTVLNARNEQRLVLIAAHFRKEVTATVLWLLGLNVRAQCFRVAPYSFGEKLFVDLRQIIPTPEAADYTIRMAAKDSEEKSAADTRKYDRKLQQEFWAKTWEELRIRGVSRFANISPSNGHYLACACGVSGCHYTLIFKRNEARVELNLQRSIAEENKWIFDELKQEMQELENRFGESLVRRRMDDRKASRIGYSKSFDSFDNRNWPEMIAWLCERIVRFDEAFTEPLADLGRRLKSGQDMPPGNGDDFQ